MDRFITYLAATAAVVLFFSIVVVVDVISTEQFQPAGTPTASSTLSVMPGFSWPTITLPSLEPSVSAPESTPEPSQTPTAPKEIKPALPQPTPAPTPVTTPVIAPIPTAPTITTVNAELDAAASALRAALVNIICYIPSGSGLHSISGSGVFIDSKGIILTNAHIAQYFLLADRGADCTIRAGSPAADKYDAALIYISPAWLRANANVITQAAPSGTGEYDFAFLAVSKSANMNALPGTFPSIPLATTPPNAGTPVVIATYGAQFLASNQVQSDLSPTVVFGSVKDIFTDHTNTIYVLARGGSAAAQEGSSGGGVADISNKLVGTIMTSTVTGDTSTRSLNAITASYIRAEYANETGSALDLLLDEPTAIAVADFAPQIPALEAIITAQLP